MQIVLARRGGAWTRQLFARALTEVKVGRGEEE